MLMTFFFNFFFIVFSLFLLFRCSMFIFYRLLVFLICSLTSKNDRRSPCLQKEILRYVNISKKTQQLPTNWFVKKTLVLCVQHTSYFGVCSRVFQSFSIHWIEFVKCQTLIFNHQQQHNSSLLLFSSLLDSSCRRSCSLPKMNKKIQQNNLQCEENSDLSWVKRSTMKQRMKKKSTIECEKLRQVEWINIFKMDR